jgi:hypothetical protein
MVMLELLPAFIICAVVYIVSRIVGYAEKSSKEKIRMREEAERKKKIAELYGR